MKFFLSGNNKFFEKFSFRISFHIFTLKLVKIKLTFTILRTVGILILMIFLWKDLLILSAF